MYNAMVVTNYVVVHPGCGGGDGCDGSGDSNGVVLSEGAV